MTIKYQMKQLIQLLLPMHWFEEKKAYKKILLTTLIASCMIDQLEKTIVFCATQAHALMFGISLVQITNGKIGLRIYMWSKGLN